MLVKTVTFYSDILEQDVTRDFHFHLSLAEANATDDKGATMTQRLISAAKSGSGIGIYNAIRQILVAGYGVVGESDLGLIKTEANTSAFASSDALVRILDGVAEDPEKGLKDIIMIFPKAVREEIKDAPEVKAALDGE